MSIQKCREPKAWLVALQVMTPAALSAGSRSLSLRLSQHTTISHGARGPGMVGKSAGTMGVARSSIGDSLKTLQWGENGEQWAAGRASQSLCVPGAPGELWAGPYNGMRTSKCGVCRPGGSVRRWLHGDAQGNMHGSSLTTHAAGSGQPDLKTVGWVAGWPKAVFGFFHAILRKNPNECFGQPNTFCCCSHSESLPESARLVGRVWSLIEPGFKSGFHLWELEQAIDCFGASVSSSIKWDHNSHKMVLEHQ